MKKKKVIRVLIIVAVFLFVSNSIATKVIYDSIFSRYDRKEPVENLSSEKYAELISNRTALEISEGKETLASYYYDAEDDGTLIVMAPGLHSGADDYIPVIHSFYKAGYDVLIFDPLGCIDSTGKSTKGFSQEVHDVEAVLDYAENNYPDKEICLFGHSRGGFAVCSLIDSDHDICAVVSVSGLNSAMEAIIGLSSRYVGQVANLNYPSLWAYQAMLFGPSMMGVRADEVISKGEVPTLIVQGSEDKTAPAEKYSVYSHKNEINEENASYILSTKEDHNGHTDLLYDEEGVNTEVMDGILEFLNENARRIQKDAS